MLGVEDDDSFAEALRGLPEADGRLEVAGRARDGREGVELAEAGEGSRRSPWLGFTDWEYEERTLEVRDAGSARAGSTQTSSTSLSLRRIAGGVAGAAGERPKRRVRVIEAFGLLPEATRPACSQRVDRRSRRRFLGRPEPRD
jgi:hypothetical protein